jgi:hypothetical protein
MLYNRRIFLLFLTFTIYACNNHSKYPGEIKNDTSNVIEANHKDIQRRPYSSFNEFRDSIYCNSLSQNPAKITHSLIKKVGRDTTIYSFDFSGIQFKCTAILLDKEGDNPCGSLFRYYFTINDKLVHLKSLPDSLRNHGFKFDNCGFTLKLEKASLFELNGITYLVIPSYTSECIGGFCHNELDHIFNISGNEVTYLTVDGWQICDVNHDNQIDQIVFNDDPIQQHSFLKGLKKENTDSLLSATQCANIQIWTLKNNQWIPLLDKNNSPYFIFLRFDHTWNKDTYEVLDYNWIKRL